MLGEQGHLSFKSARRGLEDCFALRLYHKAKMFFWDPRAIDFSEDKKTFSVLPEEVKRASLGLASLFVAGEESVTLDLLPLIQVVAREGRLEEEMFLTTFLADEARHVELFDRIIREVIGVEGDVGHFHGENYRKIFYEELPKSMNRLYDDPSPEAQVEAAVTYNMIVEGVLAETGYEGWYRSAKNLEAQGFRVPGIVEGIRHTQLDESRHIAYGVYFISRHLAANPSLWVVVERRLNQLLPYALGVVRDLFKAYPEGLPLRLSMDEFVEYASKQFERRYRRLEQARTQSVKQVEEAALAAAESGL